MFLIDDGVTNINSTLAIAKNSTISLKEFHKTIISTANSERILNGTAGENSVELM